MNLRDGRIFRMVDFHRVVKDRTGGQFKVKKRDYLPRNEIPIIDQGQALIAGYTDDTEAVFSGELPIILFGDHTLVFKYIDFPFALGADGVKALSINKSFFPKYIYYFWKSCRIQSRGYSRHFKFLKEIQLPLIPLSEQRRIVEILDQADALLKKRTDADEKAARILPALFYKMFGDPATNSKGWPVMPLADLGELDRGKSKHRPRNDQRLLGGPYPFIQTGNVANSQGYISEYSSTYSEFGLTQSRMWPAGTLCITIAANIASAAILAFDACFPDSVVGFTSGPLTNAGYIRILFGFLKPILERNAPQLAQKNINLKLLRKLPVPVPPKNLQDKFLDYHNGFFQLIEPRRIVREQSDSIWQTLLHNAFIGDLTAKWREAHMKELLAEMEMQAKALGKGLDDRGLTEKTAEKRSRSRRKKG